MVTVTVSGAETLQDGSHGNDRWDASNFASRGEGTAAYVGPQCGGLPLAHELRPASLIRLQPPTV